MQYGKKYQIDQNTKIFLYGAATTGAILYRCFTERGFQVIAFIDKRADEVDSYYGLPVFSLQEVKKYFAETPDAVVVVAVKNVFEHEKIAKELWQAGCDRIIFRPYAVVNGEGAPQDCMLNQAYDSILQGEFQGDFQGNFQGNLYRINGFDCEALKDQAVICEEESEYVVANIPVYDVWTDNYEDKTIIWGDIPCLGLVPHIGLFRLFKGEENDDYEEYIKYCRQAAERSGGIVTSQKWENSVYKNRLDVFNHMQSAWEHNGNFFIQNAVKAVYNEKGYFNIKSGKHRIVFLIVMGKQYVPLRISKSGYLRWRDEKRADRIYELLDAYHKTELPCILDSPYFYEYPCSTSDFYGRLLNKLISILYSDEYHNGNGLCFEGKKVLLYNTPLAFYAHVFRRIGFQVTIVEEKVEHRELLDVVTGEKNEFAVENIKSEESYFLIVSESNVEMNLKERASENQYILNVTNIKSRSERAFLSGCSEQGFLYAYLKKVFGKTAR